MAGALQLSRIPRVSGDGYTVLVMVPAVTDADRRLSRLAA